MMMLRPPSESCARVAVWSPLTVNHDVRRPGLPCGLDLRSEVRVTRWSDPRSQARREAVAAPEGQYLLAVALATTRVRLVNGPDLIFDGTMMAGMTYVCHPAQTLHADLTAPADFLFLHVASDAILEPLATIGVVDEDLLATVISRDALTDHLAKALQTAEDGADPCYVETLARALVMRLLQIGRVRGRVSPLPKWRLKRVVDHIEAHVAEAISLKDMAAAAGLSRMHFAAQFRLATGSRPHDFVLLQRIEVAKRLLLNSPNDLVDIALTVGFQAQAHFSTVFKRFVGEPPGRWRRARLAERSKRIDGA